MGPERPRLEALARDLNLTHVLFAGMVRARNSRNSSPVAASPCSLPTPTRRWGNRFWNRMPGDGRSSLPISVRAGNWWNMGLPACSIRPGDREQLAHSIGFLFDRPDLSAEMGAAAGAACTSKHDPDQHMDAHAGNLFPAASHASEAGIPPAVTVTGAARRGGSRRFHRRPRPGLQVQRHRILLRTGRAGTCRAWDTRSRSIAALTSLRPSSSTTACAYGGCRPSAPSIWRPSSHGAEHRRTPCSRDYDIVHYHCLGPALFSFLPRLAGKKTVVTVQGLDWQRGKWGGSRRGFCAGERQPRYASQTPPWLSRAPAAALPQTVRARHDLRSERRQPCARRDAPRRSGGMGSARRTTTFFFWGGFRRKRIAIS